MIKGIATETLAKMIIVIIVVAVVIYLIYRYVVKSPMGEQECRARMMTWCANCKFMDWKGSQMDDKLKECAETYEFYKGSRDCNENAQKQCLGFIPLTETSTT